MGTLASEHKTGSLGSPKPCVWLGYQALAVPPQHCQTFTGMDTNVWKPTGKAVSGEQGTTGMVLPRP